MKKLVILDDESALDLNLVSQTRKVPGKCVILIDANGKPLYYFMSSDNRRLDIFLRVINRLLFDKRFEQPDWRLEFATDPTPA